MNQKTNALLHQLWGDAALSEKYDKKKWGELAKEIERLSTVPEGREQGWVAVSEKLPPRDTPVVGDWGDAPLEDRWGSLQVCQHDGIRWTTFQCGSYDTRLVDPIYWKPIMPLLDGREPQSQLRSE